jgi:hypothetical protein
MKEGKLRNIRDRIIKVFIGITILLFGILFLPFTVVMFLFRWVFGDESLKVVYEDTIVEWITFMYKFGIEHILGKED